MYPRHAESAKRFGALLAQHAQRKKDEKSLREISAEVGCGSGLLSRIAKGTRRLPVRYLEPIADALGLAGEQRSEFFRLGLQAFLGDDYATIVRLVEKRKKS